MYWSDLKSVVAAKSLALQYEVFPDHYRLMAWDGPIPYDTTLWLGIVPQGILDGGYSQEQNDADKADFESNYKAAANQPLKTNTVLVSKGGSPVDISADRMLVVNFPADFGANLWLTGRGDNVAEGKRGRGTKLAMTFADVVRTEPEVQTVDIQFMEQVQLHDGHIDLKDPQNWGIEDEWELAVALPATTPTPNPGGTGNCNLYPLGGYNAIVPAAGDGAYDVDLATATPVPQAGAGGWDYDYYSNVLSFPADPSQTSWVLLDVEIVVYVQIAVNVPFSPMGMFDFDAYDAQRISPRWKLRFSVSKASNGPGVLAGWIVVFREQNT